MIRKMTVMIYPSEPYKNYRVAGVDWMRKVPEHWALGPIKRGYDIRLGKMLQGQPAGADDVEVPYLKAKHVQWFRVRTTSSTKMWVSPEEREQFGVSEGDLLVCEGGEGGRSGILQHEMDDHVIQNSLYRVRPHDGNSNAFLQYTLRTVAEIGWLGVLNDRATIAHFTRNKFSALMIAFPSPAEQVSMVRFLDHADRRIRQYIRRKERLIELLEEEKQTTIHQVVTGQIDVRTGQPYPAYKDSGIEWLGRVPAHWEVRRLKTMASNIVDTIDTQESARFCLALENVESWTGKLRLPNEAVGFDSQLKSFQGGDILFGKLRPYLAKVTRPERDGACVGEFLVLRPYCSNVAPPYMELVLRSRAVIEEVSGSTYGARMPRADWVFLGGMHIPLPPVMEQHAIVSFLDSVDRRIQRHVSATKRQIDLLQEYRTRLISDVVTGKLDVRAAAAQLPDEHDGSSLVRSVGAEASCDGQARPAT